VFPPIPGDSVTVIGAYLVGRGFLDYRGVYLSTTLGSIAGFMTIYGIAFWLEWKVIERYQLKWLTGSNMERVQNWFHRWGYWVVLANRFLSGARSVISLVAGLSRMRPLPVFALALLSCAFWNGMLIYLGSSVGKNWEEVVAFIKQYNQIVLVGILLLLVSYLIYRFLIQPSRNSQ
jgi:membrane protein DedA with SNARE-associated domain